MNCVMCTVVRALLLDVDVGFWLLYSQLGLECTVLYLGKIIIRLFTKIESFRKQKKTTIIAE